MITQSVIIQGKLVSFFDRYFKDLLKIANGFETFPQDALLYAFLEYSKYPRPYTAPERLKYLYEKCCDYTQQTLTGVILFEEEERYGYFVLSIQPFDSLPF